MSIDARLQVRAAAILEKQLQKLGKTKGVGGGDGCRDRRPAGRSQLSVAVADAAQADAARHRRHDARPRALRPVSAGVFVQGRDRDGGAAARPGQRRTSSTSASGCRTGGSGTTSRVGRGPIRDDVADSSPHGTISMRQGIGRFVQRVLRATRDVQGRAGGAARDREPARHLGGARQRQPRSCAARCRKPPTGKAR